MKQSSNFLKKALQLLLVLVIGFTGGILGTLTSFQFTKGNSANSSQEIKSTKVNRAYKNTTSTSEAVDKVKNAVVSVITYAETSEKGFINGETDSDPEVASEGSGVIYKKDGKDAYLVTNAHVLMGGTKADIPLQMEIKFLEKLLVLILSQILRLLKSVQIMLRPWLNLGIHLS